MGDSIQSLLYEKMFCSYWLLWESPGGDDGHWLFWWSFHCIRCAGKCRLSAVLDCPACVHGCGLVVLEGLILLFLLYVYCSGDIGDYDYMLCHILLTEERNDRSSRRKAGRGEILGFRWREETTCCMAKSLQEASLFFNISLFIHVDIFMSLNVYIYRLYSHTTVYLFHTLHSDL